MCVCVITFPHLSLALLWLEVVVPLALVIFRGFIFQKHIEFCLQILASAESFGKGLHVFAPRGVENHTLVH